MQRANMMLSSKKSNPVTKKKSGVKKKAQVKKQKRQPVVLTFRPRVPSDDAYIIALTRNQLGSIHEQAYGQPFPEDQFLRYLHSGAPTFLVQKNNETIGYYSYLVSPDGRMHVSALVIDPQYQSAGVGKQVMQQLETDARARGVHTLEVFVQEQNTTSLAFTRNLGFVEVYRVAPHTICFQKQLTPLSSELSARI